MMSLRRWAFLLTTFASASIELSCDSPTAPLPAGAVAFTPTSVYSWWWQQTESCSGRTGALSTVQWFVVPGVSSIATPNGNIVSGYWDPDGRRIVLAGESQYFGDLVRHEMLHALLGKGSHPRAEFIQKCSGVVVC